MQATVSRASALAVLSWLIMFQAPPAMAASTTDSIQALVEFKEGCKRAEARSKNREGVPQDFPEFPE